jgi:hypothetical protein
MQTMVDFGLFKQLLVTASRAKPSDPYPFASHVRCLGIMAGLQPCDYNRFIGSPQ